MPRSKLVSGIRARPIVGIETEPPRAPRFGPSFLCAARRLDAFRHALAVPRLFSVQQA